MSEDSDSDAPQLFCPRFEVEEARALYFDQMWSLQQIADKFNVTRQAVHDRLRKAGFTARPRGTRIHHVDGEVLRSLYLDKELSLGTIAKHFGRCRQYINDELAHFGIPVRVPKCKRRFERETLYELYIRQGLNISDVAEKLGVLPETITNELRRHGIDYRYKRGWIPNFDLEMLRRLYLDEELSIKETAERTGISPTTIGNMLRKQGINLRDRQFRRFRKNK